MKNIFFPLFIFLLVSCNGSGSGPAPTGDSMSKKDSVKKALSEDLPPPDEIHQFDWFYSAFSKALIDWNDTSLNICINPQSGLWVIDAPGAMPHFTKVMNDSLLKVLFRRSAIPLDKDHMMVDPKPEALPKVDCSKKGFYDKLGCYTTETNTFKEEKIWNYASLTPKDEDAVIRSAGTITRTVVNTDIGKFYFSLIDGKWYLTFLDIRKPCTA
ncbi:MAG TPA: hypothetical protein VL651_13765 [Bacteroidia bacterium]|nr:hypothetical protein [Bacteroidia bacterium]